VRADEKLTAFLELERVTRETLGHRGNRMMGLLERKLNLCAKSRRRDARGAIGLFRLIGSELHWLARIDSCY